MSETDNQTRLRRAKEALSAYRTAEYEARRVLAAAIESTKMAREKYESLFLDEEKAEATRRRTEYYHSTK